MNGKKQNGGRAGKRCPALILALTLVTAVTLFACNKQEAVSPESARVAVRAALDDINASNDKSETVDFTDAAQVQAYIKESRALYDALGAIALPPEDAEAQGKLKDAASKMGQYLDELPAYRAMEDPESEEAVALRNKLVNIWSSGLASIAEAQSLLWPAGTETPAPAP
ncbi:MAG: hypothetical protein LBT12_03115 [Oscillospiraceae bacterium]|jgi:type VI protein secretion system component VasK|nr:hypothetical protein [Oscillospiraceae bacterium]